MSSYPVLYNKPIDQWKVTELKEELKKRKLTTKGLKDDLIKRLDESIQNEIEIANANADKGFDSDPKPAVQSHDVIAVPETDETGVIIGKSDNKNIELNNDTVQPIVDLNLGSMVQEQVQETDMFTSTDSTMLKPDRVTETTMDSSVQLTALDTSIQATTAETSHGVTTVEVSPVVGGSLVTEINSSVEVLQNNGAPNKSEDLNIQLKNENSDPPRDEAKLNSSDLETQVYEVSKVTSDSISTDNVSIDDKVEDVNIQPQNEVPNPPHEETNPSSIAFEAQVFEVNKVTSESISTDNNVSINEKIELKDNIIANDVELEFDVKHDREEPSSSNVDLDDGNLQPTDIKEPLENEVKVEETGKNAGSSDKAKKNDIGDVELSEKLNLDRSSGDDSIEEDASESRQIDSKFISDEAGDKEKMEVAVVRENYPVDLMVDDASAEIKVQNKIGVAAASAKRKLHDQETVGNVETTKRQRRWNSEGLKVLEPHNDNASPSIAPKDTFQAKHNFSRSDSMAGVETPKERVVPPTSKPPTNALRIDRFLRPFTLKAVQELLGKTGTVTNFWMDHIKTHCYVIYSSVEEATATRNAVYNLQWPPNGGRLLVAEFVEPQEVQLRVEAPSSPAAPVNAVPVLHTVPIPVQPQPSPRVQVQRHVQPPMPVPPVSLPPPPPPLANPPAARDQVVPLPPPAPEKVEPPIVTLDDLFRKTRATPRIYYLPLSDEQVKAKQNAEGNPPSSRD